MLGDPAARDAMIHSVQACIPHARLLPVSVSRIELNSIEAVSLLSVHARERYREGDLYVYDLELINADGRVQEKWEGLHLKKIEAIPATDPWAVPLLGPYMERCLHELIPDVNLTVALQRDGVHSRDARSDSCIRQALGRHIPINRRLDGNVVVGTANFDRGWTSLVATANNNRQKRRSQNRRNQSLHCFDLCS